MINNVAYPPLSSILPPDTDKAYLVPRYQREYTWGQWNWESLYDDVFSNEIGYFLGSIILIQRPVDPNTNVIEYEVIDGQQRLTTVSILLTVFYEKLSGLKSYMDDDDVFKLMMLRNRIVLSGDKSRSRVVPQVQNNNLADFRWLLHERVKLKGLDVYPLHYGNRRIARAYRFFSKRIDQAVEEENRLRAVDGRAALDEEGKVGYLQQLVDKLLSAVLVQIQVDNHSDAYTLFASLNNRGVPLTAVDLIKNTLLSHLDTQSDAELDSYFGQWQMVLSNLGDEYQTQERFFRQNYDAFRRAVNAPYATELARFPLGAVATRTNLLAIYEKRIKDDAEGVLEELLDNSKIYGSITSPYGSDLNNEVVTELVRLSHIQGAPSYMLLLHLMKRSEELGIDEAMLADIIHYLVSFFVRRNLTDTPPTRDLERMFIRICEAIEDEGAKGADAVALIKRNLLAVSSNDAAFEQALRGPIFEDSPDSTRFILTELATPSVTKEMRGLWERNNSGMYVWTIEHVFPQGSNIPQAWVDMIAGGDKDKASELQELYVHTLGNLTLTGYNSTLSNRSFDEKKNRVDRSGNKVGYLNGLNINADIACYDEWTVERIQQRTDRLVAEVVELFAM